MPLPLPPQPELFVSTVERNCEPWFAAYGKTEDDAKALARKIARLLTAPSEPI